MKNTFSLFAGMLSLFLVFTSISGTAQIIGNHQVKEESRKISKTFQQIRSTGPVDIILKQGPVTTVVVRADANIIPYISTTVGNGTLTVSTQRNIRFAKVMEVYVTTPEINQISASGSGDIRCKDVFKAPNMKILASGSGDVSANLKSNDVIIKVTGSGDVIVNGIHGDVQMVVSGSGDVKAGRLQLMKCTVKNEGSGDIFLDGKTASLAIVSAGSGDIDASQLMAVDVKATNSGSGDIAVHPIQKLYAALAGSGDLTYYGNPAALKTQSTGSGDIRKR